LCTCHFDILFGGYWLWERQLHVARSQFMLRHMLSLRTLGALRPEGRPRMNNSTGKLVPPSVLAPDLEVTGDITSKGTLVVQARVIGNIAADVVSIQQWANVEGDIEAKWATIEGTVVGAVIAEEVRVAHSGQIKGSVHYAKLAVEAGASIEGNLRKITATQEAVQPSASPSQ
jgi:cytoskeletal protein CcmA (bactofilin family)